MRREDIREYLKIDDVSNCLAITLTMKQYVNAQVLDDIASIQNLKHFMNCLNKQILGNKFSRYKHRIDVIPALERANDRYHYHLLMRLPEGVADHELMNRIAPLWKKTRFGADQIDIQTGVSTGWIDYITKLQNKEDTVDWENLHWKD